jgi:hypothetical protein
MLAANGFVWGKYKTSAQLAAIFEKKEVLLKAWTWNTQWKSLKLSRVKSNSRFLV